MSKKGDNGRISERDSPKTAYQHHDSLILEESRSVLRVFGHTHMVDIVFTWGRVAGYFPKRTRGSWERRATFFQDLLATKQVGPLRAGSVCFTLLAAVVYTTSS